MAGNARNGRAGSASSSAQALHLCRKTLWRRGIRSPAGREVSTQVAAMEFRIGSRCGHNLTKGTETCGVLIMKTKVSILSVPFGCSFGCRFRFPSVAWRQPGLPETTSELLVVSDGGWVWVQREHRRLRRRLDRRLKGDRLSYLRTGAARPDGGANRKWDGMLRPPGSKSEGLNSGCPLRAILRRNRSDWL
jgi:hypothetical protein